MSLEIHCAQALFLDDFDKSTPENIIHLEQRLKGLRKEIEQQLEADYIPDDEGHEQYVKGVTKLIADIDQAMSSLENLVNLVSNQSDEFKKNFYQSDEVQLLDHKIRNYLDKLTTEI